jgi:hypothetical protein
MVSFMPQMLHLQGKSPQYPLDRRLGRLQGPSRQHREEKVLDHTGTKNSDPSVIQPVAIPNSLYWKTINFLLGRIGDTEKCVSIT